MSEISLLLCFSLSFAASFLSVHEIFIYVFLCILKASEHRMLMGFWFAMAKI